MELIPCPVQTLCASTSAGQFFSHQLRWGVFIRQCRPWGYVGQLFTKGLPWSVAAALMAPSHLIAIACLTVPLAARLGVALSFGAYGMKDPLVARRWWLIPLRDALEFLTWVLALLSNRVRWGGSEFYVRRGRLISLRSRPCTTGASISSRGPAW